MSVMEISHRSKPFDEIIQGAEADFRKLAGLTPEYKVLFLQGGASLQFSMVPMNLLAAGQTADYIVTGDWSKKALKEGETRRNDERGGDHRERELPPHSPPGRNHADAGRGLRAHDVEQHDFRHRVGQRAGGRRCAARVRCVIGHLLRAARRLEVRRHLRRRAEEPRAVGRDRGRHPRGSRRALA